jgi:phosphatidylethanolamine-binding protein (PEBP) family uncharacterized protein
MKSKLVALVVGAMTTLAALPALPGRAEAAGPPLFVHVEGLDPPGYLPLSAAGCPAPGADGMPQDRNPGISWSAGPKGTEYYALIMADMVRGPIVQAQTGSSPAHNPPKHVFVHWLLANIPVGTTAIAAGADSNSFTPGGKPATPAPVGLRGQNNYAQVYAHHPGFQGPWAGYDGPCPSRHKSVTKGYAVIVVAVDQALPLSPGFTWPQLVATFGGHVLAVGEATVKFSFGVSR